MTAESAGAGQPHACCAASRPPAPVRYPSERLTPPGRSRVGGMVRVPGGTFQMGNEDDAAQPGDGEGPLRQVTLAPFLIDPRAVSNAEFAEFVRATGHRTEAERYGWSYVFAGFLDPETVLASHGPAQAAWWRAIE